MSQTSSLRYAATSLLRGGVRSLAYLIGLGVALALFSTTLFFIDGSAATLTQRAIAPVLLDFQARATDPQLDITTLESQFRTSAQVSAVQPFVSAAVGVLPKATATGAPVTGATLPTRLFAVPTTYPATFGVIRLSAGGFPSGAHSSASNSRCTCTCTWAIPFISVCPAAPSHTP